MSKPVFCLYLAPAIAAGLAVSCARGRSAEAHSSTPDVPAVAVARACAADLSRELTLAAEFRPFQEIDVHAKVAGYVKRIFVDVGDHVRQGQRLAVLEIPEMQDDLARAEAARRRSDADLARARDELQRAESAHSVAHLSYQRLAEVIKAKPDLVAQQEIDEALSRDRVLEAGVSAARSALAAAEQQVQVARADTAKVRTLAGYAEITAPFTGVISRRYADTGAMIQAGTASQTQAMPLVRLSQNDLLRLVLPVPETAVPRIHTGAAVEVRVPTLNRNFPGHVARFSDKVQYATRTMETEVDVPNPSLVLIPGMYAEVALTLDRHRDALSVPVEALAGRTENLTVLVVAGGRRIEERPVRLGIETPERVEVLSGLRENELVVVGSRSRFKPGDVVEPRLVEPAQVKEER